MTNKKDSETLEKSSQKLDNILINDDWFTGYTIANFEYDITDPNRLAYVWETFDNVKNSEETMGLFKHVKNCILNDIARGGASGLNADKIQVVQGVFLGISLVEEEIKRMSELYMTRVKRKPEEELINTPFVSITNQ